MSEARMRSKLVKLLEPLDALAVENVVYPGTPDINYVEGWIECKYLEKWPKFVDKRPLQIRHFTPQQRAWLRVRASKGGNVFVIIKVGREWLLLDGSFAAKNIGNLTRPELQVNAIKVWKVRIIQEELLYELRSRNINKCGEVISGSAEKGRNSGKSCKKT